MRSAIGGWVDIRRETSWARNGLAIIMWLGVDDLLGRGEGCPGHAELELAQRRREGERVAGEAGAVLVGVVLAGAGDGELHDHRRERGEDRQGQAGDRVAVLVARPAAEDHAEGQELPDRRDDAGDGGGHRRGEDVAVVDVHQLVAEHPAQLALVEQAEDALGAADGGVLGVAARSRRRWAPGSARCTAAASACPAAVDSSRTMRYIAGASASLTG